MQSIAETCVRFDAAHLSINLVSEIAVPMFPTLRFLNFCLKAVHLFIRYDRGHVAYRICTQILLPV